MVEYIINPSVSRYGKDKIRKSGLEKALKKGNWGAFLPESDKKNMTEINFLTINTEYFTFI